MPKFSLSVKLRRNLWIILGLLLAARLLAQAVLPLTDTTESRYGEIARIMLETANWVTPQYDYGVPFWAKPPLSTWLSAASMGVFGVNEFAARLPELLLGLGMLGLVWLLAKKRYNRDFGLLSVAVLASLSLFFVASGAVMTDASLALSTTISFVAFWLAMSESDRRQQLFWGYLFFAGQGLGLLAKGPICGVLTLVPIVLWTWSRGNRWRLLWQRLPWITGSLVMLAIAAPWYILAEQRTPGFLDYFIVGEHIKRFLVTGWHGDKYGHPHKAALGTIWAYWLIGAFPWSLIAIGWATRRFRSLKALFQDQDGWALYLLWWVLWPLLFFTLAHNILWTYTITGLPAFALLVAELWLRDRQRQGRAVELPMRRSFWLTFNVPTLIALTASLVLLLHPAIVQNATQKAMAHRYLALRSSADSQFYYLFTRYYSAEFYTRGRAHYAQDFAEVRKLLNNDSRDFLALKEKMVDKIPEDIARHFSQVARIGNVLLLEEKPLNPS